MSDDDETADGVRKELAAGVELEYNPVPGGKLRLAIYYQDTPVLSNVHNKTILGSDQLQSTFINRVRETLGNQNGVDADAVCVELRQWFAEMNELSKQEEKETLLPDEIQAIIEGTEYPIEVYGGETTTWKVTLTFAGRTRELEFTSSEMVADNGNILQEKIANQFFEILEIGQEDWEAIRERWQENKEVVGVVDETGDDTVAARVSEYLSHNVQPVVEREKLANSPATAWYDAENGAASDVAGPGEAILWVHDSFVVDQLEQVGNIKSKSKIIKKLNERGDLHGVESDGRKYWPNPQGKDRTKFYAFKPGALGVSRDDVGDASDPNHSEVEA